MDYYPHVNVGPVWPKEMLALPSFLEAHAAEFQADLRRIMDGEYGYCEETGEPIGIPRLLARPTATVCVDVKGHNEQIEAQYRDR